MRKAKQQEVAEEDTEKVARGFGLEWAQALQESLGDASMKAEARGEEEDAEKEKDEAEDE